MAEEIKVKGTADHNNSDLSIYTMVLNRLPIIEDSESNQDLISSFILEVMHVMETCFNQGSEKIGIESNYSILQQSVIADLTCLQILMIAAIETTGGNATDGSEALTTFLKKAKAGSVEVEFGPIDLKNNATLAMSAETYFKFFKRNAINKASQLGCLIDITDEASIMFLVDNTIRKPFIVVGCNSKVYGGETIPERNLKY